jgi:hypothetical protein
VSKTKVVLVAAGAAVVAGYVFRQQLSYGVTAIASYADRKLDELEEERTSRFHGQAMAAGFVPGETVSTES